MEERPVPSPNAYDFYLAACEAMVDRKLPESCSGGCACQAEQRELTLEEKSAIVERNSAALQKLREGFAYEYFVPGEIESSLDLFDLHTGGRRLAKLLQMESEVLAAKGDPAAATDSLLDIVRLGSDLPRGGSVMCMLVGHAFQIIGRYRVWQYVDHLGAESARILARRAESLYHQVWPFTETIQYEKRWLLAYLNEKCRHWHWKFTLAGQCACVLGWIEFLRALVRILPLSKQAVLADYERFMDAQIAFAGMPYSVAEGQPEVAGNYVSVSLGFDARSGSRVQADNGLIQKAFLAVALACMRTGSIMANIPAT